MLDQALAWALFFRPVGNRYIAFSESGDAGYMALAAHAFVLFYSSAVPHGRMLNAVWQRSLK